MGNWKNLRRLSPFRLIPDNTGRKPCGRIPRSGNARRYSAVLVAACVVLLVGPYSAFGKDLSKKELGRLLLIRGLDREIAVAKIPLPRGKHGLFVNDKGQIDKEKAREEFLKNGTGIRPGIPVEITKIEFKHHSIVFQINNGGKRHKKWWQHIEIGMGGVMQPVDPKQQQNPIAYGSAITVTFPHGKTPELTTEQAKKILSSVLDFHRKRPTELYSPNLPKKFKEAIKKHEVVVGMNKDAVLSSRGMPFRKIRETKPNGEEREDWLYGLPPHVLFVVFSGGVVISVHQY